MLTDSLAFAKELEGIFSTPIGLKISPALVDKLENQIQSFPRNLGSAAAIKYGEFDKTGTALWNMSSRLRRNDDLNNQQTQIVLAMARLYALLMLDCAQRSGGGSTNVARVMKVALKTAKQCLGAIHLPTSKTYLYFTWHILMTGYRPQTTRLCAQSLREGSRTRPATKEPERRSDARWCGGSC